MQSFQEQNTMFIHFLHFLALAWIVPFQDGRYSITRCFKMSMISSPMRWWQPIEAFAACFDESPIMGGMKIRHVEWKGWREEVNRAMPRLESRYFVMIVFRFYRWSICVEQSRLQTKSEWCWSPSSEIVFVACGQSMCLSSIPVKNQRIRRSEAWNSTEAIKTISFPTFPKLNSSLNAVPPQFFHPVSCCFLVSAASCHTKSRQESVSTEEEDCWNSAPNEISWAFASHWDVPNDDCEF